MSKFIDRLKRLTEGSPQPIGFQSIGKSQARLKIQLVASLSRDIAENPTGDLKLADAGLVRLPGAASAETIKRLCAAAEIPWGVWMEGSGAAELQPLVAAGADFLIFGPAAPLASLLEEKVGRIIELGESSLNDVALRVLNTVPVDAVFVSLDSAAGRALTWQDLVAFQRFAALVTRPVLALVPASITAKELQAVWEGGVDGVVISVPTPEAASGLKDLRQMIDGLQYPAPPHRDRGLALAPRVSPKPEPEEEEEEDEE
jgi:hypothetical protein